MTKIPGLYDFLVNIGAKSVSQNKNKNKRG